MEKRAAMKYQLSGKYGLEGRMMDNVELYIRTGTFPSEYKTSQERSNFKRASRNVIYKDKCLFKSYKGRLLKVVRSLEQLPEILTHFHEDNGHAGYQMMREKIMSLYWWGNVTNAVKDWVKKCPKCQHRILGRRPAETQSLQCLAYGCESSSWNNSSMITFHKFPKDPAIREKWLSVAQRDGRSVRGLSRLCSNHFDPSCFQVNEEGQVILKPEAVPTIMAVQREVQVAIPEDELSLQFSTLEELITASGTAETVETSETSEAALEHPDLCGKLLEHQYSLPPLDANNRTGIQGVIVASLRTHTAEPCFVKYDNIERYLTHRILPPYTKGRQNSLKISSKRFAVIDGVLMYTRVNPPRKVPRSKEEVKGILCRFHDNQGHRGLGICQRVIWKQFFWATLTKDLAIWISTCDTCINRTKKRGTRCSVYKCTNSCGPVERGLGLNFHKFPIENPALLSRWLRNLGRPNWQPRIWSTVCSSHFTEDCFDHSGNEVCLRPDAVPSLFVYNNPWDPDKTDSAQPAPLDWVTTQDQMFFAKYDAVERYLRRRTYPPGLNSVEKNTFRRFAKNYIIKDDEMHMMRGGHVRRVLRSREDVELALVSYHNDLNHLDVKKCLRLLNERYSWKTMKPDVVRWIDNCSECSGTKKRTILKEQMELQFSGVLEPTEGLLETMVGSPQLPQDSYTISDYGDDDDEDEEELPECSLTDRKCRKKPDSQSLARKEDSKSQPERQPQPCLQTKFAPRIQGLKTDQPQSHTPKQMSTSRNSGTQLHSNPGMRNQPAKLTNAEPCFQTQTQTGAQTPTSSQVRPKRMIQDLVSECPAKRTPSQSQRVDPLVTQGPQTWPTLSDSESIRANNVKLKYSSKGPNVPPVRGNSPLQARVVVQHCSQARLKVRPAMDGAEAHWVEIQEGMVVYVCFFQGATLDVVQKMVDTVMNAKLFRNASRLPVSVLELPGSVLLVPQDSLLGDQLVLRRKRIQYQEGCPPWESAQLYINLVSDCRTAMATYSAKCKRPLPLRGTVEHGIYGQKQDIILSSPEPLTHLLEF